MTVDTRDMLYVHGALSNEFERLRNELAESALAGDAVWSNFLSRWNLMRDFLVEHHTGEDRLLWPLLTERLPADHAIFEEMASEHQTVHKLLDDADALVTRIDTARKADADRVADLCGQCDGILAEMLADLSGHLFDEETKVLPIVPDVLTEAEWGTLPEEAGKILGEENSLLVLGYVLKWLEPADQEVMLSKVPPPVAEIWATTGAETFRRFDSVTQE